MSKSLISFNGQDDPTSFLPAGWKAEQLNATCDIFGGGRLGLTKEKDYRSSGVLAFSAAGPDGFVEQAEISNKSGVILSAIGANCGRCFYAQGDWTTLANVQAIVPKSEINPRYLYYFVNRDGYWDISGSAQPFIKPSSIRSSWIGYPPIPEQSKIVEVLSKVDQAIELTEALIAKQQRIKTGLMQDLFTRGIDEYGNLRSEETHDFKDSPIGRIPVEWRPSTLGKLAKFNSGYAFKNEELAEFGWRVVRISNLHKQDFPYWHYEGPVKESWKICDGDILFSWAGVATSIDCVRYQGPEALMNQHIYNLIFESDSLRSFVYFFLQQYLPVLRTEIEGGAGQLHLTKAKIQGIHIPTMNSDELKKILAVLEQHEKQTNETRNQLSKLCSLKTALMQDLLTGKKRVTPLMTNMEVCS